MNHATTKQLIFSAIEQRRIVKAAEIKSAEEVEYAAKQGADVAALYHTTKLGLPKIGGMLPFGNANETVLKLLEEIKADRLPIPVIAGLCGTEPFRIRDTLALRLLSLGVTGVQNFPTVGITDGVFRENLDFINQGYEKECALMRKTAAVGLLCMPFVFNSTEALNMSAAGAEIVICHAGAMAMEAGYSISWDKMKLHVERFSTIGREIKLRYPNVKVLIYTENDHHISNLLEYLETQPAIDGLYNSRSDYGMEQYD